MSKVVITEGIVVNARFGKTKFSDKKMNRIGVRYIGEAMKEHIEAGKEAFKEAGKKMTPSFVNEKSVIEDTGEECIYLNYHSKFDIPVKGDVESFDEILPGAKVKVATVYKEGCFYPRAIIVIENGEELNPFDGME